MSATPASEKKAALIFNLQLDLGQGLQFGVSGNMYEGQTPAERNALLDEVVGMAQRQKNRALIPVIEARIADRQRALKQAKTDFAEKAGRLIGLREEMDRTEDRVKVRRVSDAIERQERDVLVSKDMVDRVQEELSEAEERLKATLASISG